MCITYDLCIDRMKMFPVDIYKFIMWWRFYSNVCAVDSSDYIRKTVSLMLACLTALWEFNIPGWDADNSIPLGWHGTAQGRLAQSQSVGLCIALQHHPQLCAQFQGIALRNLKWLMSQSPSCESKSSLSLNTRSLSSNTAKAAVVFNGMPLHHFAHGFISTRVIADTRVC